MNDPIIEEVRQHRQAHAARYNNDLAAICKALQSREQTSGRIVVNRQPRHVHQTSGTTNHHDNNLRSESLHHGHHG